MGLKEAIEILKAERSTETSSFTERTIFAPPCEDPRSGSMLVAWIGATNIRSA